MPASDLRPHPPRRRADRFALAAALLLSGVPAASADPGAFSAFAGSFRGNGEMVARDGHHERIRCRVTGAVGGGGRTMSQNIVCASDSYKFDIRGQVIADGASARGEWQETTRGVSGEISGRISGNHFSGFINAGGFAAGFSLYASGRRLSFSLRPNESAVAGVDVLLMR